MEQERLLSVFPSGNVLTEVKPYPISNQHFSFGFFPQLLLHNTKNFRYIPRVMTPLLFSLQLIHLFHSFLSENHSDSVSVYFPLMEKQ